MRLSVLCLIKHIRAQIMKICKDCNIEKAFDMFYGVQNECKECTKRRVKINSKRVGNAYDFSEKGVFRVIYKTQKRYQKIRGHGDMPYTKEQLIDWCKSNGFDELYSLWVESGNKSALKPSVDRIDDFSGYSLKNIRLGTWQDNRDHQASDIISGIGTGGKRCKPLLKFDGDMKLICEYHSFSAAKRDVGYHMEYAIKNGTTCKMGFYWKYK